MTYKEIDKLIEMNNYPDNYLFKSGSLQPYGTLETRVKRMQLFIPEMFKAGDTFLDIGCSKGFWCFYLKDRFKLLSGIDIDPMQIDIADKIKEKKKLDHIKFHVAVLENIKDEKADTVYVGGVHHYLFREDMQNGREPMSFVHTLKEMTKAYLIIDGVMNYSDFAFRDIIRTEGYTEDIYKQYSLENIKKILEPEFEFIRSEWDGVGDDSRREGTSGRFTTVFKRK